ncbi:hypothetical protein Tco_1397294, partial [Tanacetum coccineum]
VIKGEVEKIKDIKVKDVLLACDTQLEVFNNEVNRLSRIHDDSKHDDDMGYHPSDVAFIECELKDEALRNKAIMEGLINEDDNEPRYKQKRQWNMRYMMIKYSFNDDEEYVAVKEDEYNDLTITRKEACQAYQVIFRIMDEGWMLEICTLQMRVYISSQNSCDFTAVTIIGESKERRTIEGIIRNYYDREDGETTPRFEV